MEEDSPKKPFIKRTLKTFVFVTTFRNGKRSRMHLQSGIKSTLHYFLSILNTWALKEVYILPSDLILKNSLSVPIHFERDRDSTSRGGVEREGDRIPSRLRAAIAEPNVGFELPKPQDHDLRWNQESDA